MDVRAEINYPDSSPDEVFAMLCDPGYRSQVCEDTHALGYDVDIEEDDDGGATVTVRRTMPAEVPDFVKKFVGETIELRQTETWGTPDASGTRTADLRLEISGQPASMGGSIVLEPLDGGSRQRVEGDMKVSIPILGKKIEPEVVKGVLAGIRQEERTGIGWLAEH
jgi:hypothetical protein